MTEHFDLAPDLIYLNSANLSISPRIVNEAVTRYRNEFEKNPTRGLAKAWEQLWEVQCELAAFLGANPKDLILRPNITSVLNTFLLGIPSLSPGEILVGEMEYGSIVNICRLRANREGHTLRKLKLPLTPVAVSRATRKSLADDIISQLGPRTRVVLLSHVLVGTGLIIPIEEIARETHRRGIYLVVDGAYAPGAIPVDFTTLADVDFYGCSLYKWMLGPKGTAFGWVAPRHQATLSPISAGWTTFETFGRYEAFGNGSPFQARFQLSGCQNFAPYFALHEMLLFWRRLGAESIYKRIATLTEHLRSEMGQRPRWRPLIAKAEIQSPLSAYIAPPEWRNEKGEIFADQILEDFGVQGQGIWIRDNGTFAISPHVYNTEDQITIAVNRLTSSTDLERSKRDRVERGRRDRSDCLSAPRKMVDHF